MFARWGPTAALAGIVASYVVLALTYNVLQPIWESPDEPEHFAFVRYVQVHHALPRGAPGLSSVIDPNDPTKEFSQTPLYYVALAVALAPIPLGPGPYFHLNPFWNWPDHPWRHALAIHRPDEGWPFRGVSLFVHLGRLFAMLGGVAALLATYSIVKQVLGRAAYALFATAWLAWIPGFILGGARLDNDGAALGWSALALVPCTAVLVAPGKARGRHFALIGLTLTGALLSKASTAYLIPIAVVAVLAALTGRGWPHPLPLSISNGEGRSGGGAKRRASGSPWRRGSEGRGGGEARSFAEGPAAMAALALGIPGAACLAWWLAIGRTFGGRVGSQAGLGVLSFGQAIRSFGWPRLLDALAMWNGTWWQGVGVGLSFGPTIMYTLLTIPFLALVVGGLWTLAGGPGHALPPRARFAAIVLAVGAIPLFYATIARQAFASVSLDASARFTLPAAPILALLVAIGASRLPLGRFRRPLGLGYLAALLTLSVVTPLVFFPDLAIPVVPARLPANAQEAHGPAIARFANGIDLLAVSAPAALTAGQPLPITLHWRVERTPPDNAIAYVHLVGPAGRRLAGSDAIPLEKTYAPTLWQAGEIVDERRSLAAPSQLTPGNYRLDVGLYHLDPTGTRITPVPLEPAGPPDEAATAVRWQILPDASGLASASPISASFGPRLTLLADRVDLAGSTASARLYWKATAPIARRLVVSVQALDARGRLVAQNDSEPAGGLLPTTTWRPGDVIADDHRIQLPAGADPPSSYIVAVYDRQTLARLDVTESGRPAGDHVTLAITPVVAARAQSR